jgi:hypothetical protein
MRANEAAKREAYAAIVANSLTPARASDEERLFFLDVVGRSRTLHLRVRRPAPQSRLASS